MAKQSLEAAPETIAVPVSLLQELRDRLENLEGRERIRQEMVGRPHQVLDDSYEKVKAELGRPASERTQDIADAKYGKEGQRWHVRLDGVTEDGKPGPNIAEHFPLVLSANSDLEAQARWSLLMGVKRHNYRIIATPVAA